MNQLFEEETIEERRKKVEKALAISMTGATAPSEKTLELTEQYVNGEKSLEEITKQVINYYQKKENE